MGSTDDLSAHRELKSALIRAGWPDSSSYTEGLQYGLRIKAIELHEAFLTKLVDLCITGWIDKAKLLYLGPCARTNFPRAANLCNMIESGEGGGGDTKLPNFWEWPVIKGIDDI